MSNEIICNLEKEKIIVIVRGVEKEKLLPLAEAMYLGGIRFLEITYSADGSISDEETANEIKLLAKNFENRMYIGAGTVLTQKQVELTKASGGRFIISPDVYPEVIKKTKELGMVSIPGAFSASEVMTAKRCGADFVKLFPITDLGTSYVNALRAPFPDIKFLAVGGICEENIKDYSKAGVYGFGIGSNIVSKELLEKEDYEAITLLAKKYVAAVK